MNQQVAMAVAKAKLVTRAAEIKEEIEQIFLDAEYWNQHVRKPEEEKIDPDPRGELKAALDYVRTFLGQA